MPSMTGKLKNTLPAGLMLCLALGVSACNTPTEAVKNIDEPENATQQAATEAKEEAIQTASNIKHRRGKVSAKGTHIQALVNGEVITNYDVQRRAAFLKLRRVQGNRTSKARDEMVEQVLKMQEAKKRGTIPNKQQVETAFDGFAKGNRMTRSQLTQVLSRSGVTPQHFKDFIGGQIAWNNTVGSKFRSQTQQKTPDQTMIELRKKGEQKPQTHEYLLQQVIFVQPKIKQKTGIKQRKIEAAAFQKLFQSCGTTKQLAVGQRDVTVKQLPRILEPQLPPEWAEFVKSTPVGAATPVLETDKGVEFLAVCTKKVVSDDRAAAIVVQSGQFDKFNNEVGTKVSAELLEELKKNATIIYR